LVILKDAKIIYCFPYFSSQQLPAQAHTQPFPPKGNHLSVGNANTRQCKTPDSEDNNKHRKIPNRDKKTHIEATIQKKII